MRVLLDENVDRRLKQAFDSRFEVLTVREHGWSGKKNGDLLASAAAEFDALFTLDRNMQHQQHLSAYDLAVVLVTAVSNRRSAIEPAMPEVNRLLPTVQPGRLYVVAA
jgi:predicted nuclease of predicted toxin-antitoxin system